MYADAYVICPLARTWYAQRCCAWYSLLRIRDMSTYYSSFIIHHSSFIQAACRALTPSVTRCARATSLKMEAILVSLRYVTFMHFSQQIRNQYIILLWGYCTYFWDKNVYNICVNISGVKSSISVTRILLSGENVLSSFRNPGERKWYRIFYAGHTQKRTEAS